MKGFISIFVIEHESVYLQFSTVRRQYVAKQSFVTNENKHSHSNCTIIFHSNFSVNCYELVTLNKWKNQFCHRNNLLSCLCFIASNSRWLSLIKRSVYLLFSDLFWLGRVWEVTTWDYGLNVYDQEEKQKKYNCSLQVAICETRIKRSLYS